MKDVEDNVLKDVADDPVLPPQSSDDLICDGIRQAPDAETSNLSRQAYFAAPTFDIDDFEQLVRVHLERSQDHLWLLQTDPSEVFHAADSFNIEIQPLYGNVQCV
jgi:hypothetical protein